jgi:hypothetical protein
VRGIDRLENLKFISIASVGSAQFVAGVLHQKPNTCFAYPYEAKKKDDSDV